MTKLETDDACFDAEVDRVHAAYKAEIAATFERYRAQFGYEARELVFVEDSKSK